MIVQTRDLTNILRPPGGHAVVLGIDSHYPIDGSAVERSRIVALRYSPVAHFSRRLEIARIRLESWQAR